MINEIKRINELVKQLNEYRDKYYNDAKPPVTDTVYDKKYDELSRLEKEVGYILNNSPTQSVGYEVKSSLQKVTHEYPMLSLDKTKLIDDIKKFVGDKQCLMMLKMDGLTVALTYSAGKLIKAETRGNGVIGEDILHTAKTFINLPNSIPYYGKIVIMGEAIITYGDFERINNAIVNEDDKYKNPRNLCSGSVRQLDAQVAAKRNIRFIAWRLEDGNTSNSFAERLAFVIQLGFETVPFIKFNKSVIIEEIIDELKDKAEILEYPIDGLVVGYDDVNYGKSLGATNHHLRSQLAFKFGDSIETTKLIDVEFTMGVTGVLTPTAVFEPVEIEGTTVERASLHNISIMDKLGLKYGCTLYVYKANMIIPQVDSCENDGNGQIIIPTECPICGAETDIKRDKDTKVLRCTNDECKGKLLGKMCHFVSKDGLDIQGLSEASLERFIELDWLKSYDDIFNLKEHKDIMTTLDGFGKKSVEKLLEAIEKSKIVKLEKFIDALSIPNVGTDAAKKISKVCGCRPEALLQLIDSHYLFSNIEGIGNVINSSIYTWADNLHNRTLLEALMNILTFDTEQRDTNSNNSLKGKTFVITGTVTHFKNRSELQSKIEELGGKCAGSISNNTSYLINNDSESFSSKNVSAKKLGVKIITEEEFIDMLGK